MGDRERSAGAVVQAPVEAVVDAVSGPQGLSIWLADEARSEKKPGGRVSLWWHGGRQATGRWVAYDPPESMTLRVRFDDAAEYVRLAFTLRGTAPGTRIEARLEGESEAAAEAWSPLWRHALADIQLFAETGKSGRYLRRPMLGINLEEVDEEMARARDLPVQEGILIVDVVEDSAAAKAGLAKGDILVEMGDRSLTGWAAIGAALDAHQAGDAVPVTLWRDGRRQSLEVVLGGREEEPLSRAADEVRVAIADSYGRMRSRLEALTAGLSEARSDFQPGEGEWSVKQVLAHLSDSERWFADDVLRLAVDEPSVGWAPKTYELRARHLARMPLDHAVRRLDLDLLESQTQAVLLLEDEPSPALVGQLAQAAKWSPEHFEEHVAQIEANLAAAREAGIE